VTDLQQAATAVLTARQRAMLARDSAKEYEDEARPLYTERTAANAALSEAEQAARNARIQHWSETGELGAIYGLGVRKTMEPEYDELEAIRWCLEHGYETYVKLDARAFAAIAQEQPLPFVRWKRKVTATIAGDGLAAAIRSSVEGEAQGPDEADDALAALAQAASKERTA
jgi:hypothetical protein